MKNVITLLLIITAQSIAFSQGPPPLQAETATKENQLLIDEIIELTHFKEQYTEICTSFIERTAKERGWDTKEIERRKQGMDADRFIRMNFYTTMAFLSSEDLRETITFLKKINKKNPYHDFFLSDLIISNNFLIHVNSLIE